MPAYPPDPDAALLARARRAENESVFTLGEYNRLLHEGIDMEVEQDRRRLRLLSAADVDALWRLDPADLDALDARAREWAIGGAR